MKIVHISYSDARGGAAIGARRNHEALLSCGADSILLVVEKYSNDPTIKVLEGNKALRSEAEQSERTYRKRAFQEGSSFQSFNLIDTGSSDLINKISPDIILLHWIGRNTIGIQELPKLKSELFWKLPDMWPFCGAEHYVSAKEKNRYVSGYSYKNKGKSKKCFDFDRLIWRIKYRYWRDLGLSIITPSTWLGRESSKSALYFDKNILHINNPINASRFRPLNQQLCRKKLDIDAERVTIVFGAFNATQDKRKGYEYIKSMIPKLIKLNESTSIQLLIFGAEYQSQTNEFGLPVHYFKQLNTSVELVEFYSAADIFLFPSLQDNSPNVVKEASCCGALTVAFNVGGLSDLVDHLNTGYLAEPFEELDLLKGLEWSIKNISVSRRDDIARTAHLRHDMGAVGKRYLEAFEAKLQQKQS